MGAFIIDVYNPLRKLPNVHLVFTINGIQYCIRETELEWGQPIPSELVDDDDNSFYYIYETYDEALAFARELKKQNG